MSLQKFKLKLNPQIHVFLLFGEKTIEEKVRWDRSLGWVPLVCDAMWYPMPNQCATRRPSQNDEPVPSFWTPELAVIFSYNNRKKWYNTKGIVGQLYIT